MNSADPHVQDVAVRGFTWAAAAGWATFSAIAGSIAVIVKSIGFPRLVELLFTRSKQLRDEAREEELADTVRLVAAEKRATAAESRQVYLASAVSLLIGVLEQIDPNNPGLRQARELVAMAADTDDGFGRALKRLAEVSSVGETT